MKWNKWLSVTVFFLFGIAVFAGCGRSEENKDAAVSQRKIDSTNIHPANIDVASLDKNKDGKVFQCPMDWQVISDSAGTCSICLMDLESYSVAEAQKNLTENHSHNH
jgi:hypothetical protein